MRHPNLLDFSSLYHITVVQNDTTGLYSAMVFCGSVTNPEYETEEFDLGRDAFDDADAWIENQAERMLEAAEREHYSDP